MSEQPIQQPWQPSPPAAQPRPPAPMQPPAPPVTAPDPAAPQQPIINVHIQQPPPPAPAPPPPPVVVPANNDSNWHIAHLVITLFTCGAWAPVWIVHAIVMASRKPSQPLPPPPNAARPWPPGARPLPPEQTNQMAIHAVTARARRRAEARQLAHQNPLMARELFIGRTDMPAEGRPYDDGGLIDVNMVPARELTRFGLDPDTADRIVELREHTGGFTSAEDLATVADLPPKLLPELLEYGLYLR